jgi:hypothetical protein
MYRTKSFRLLAALHNIILVGNICPHRRPMITVNDGRLGLEFAGGSTYKHVQVFPHLGLVHDSVLGETDV